MNYHVHRHTTAAIHTHALTNNEVKLKLAHRMVLRYYTSMPTNLIIRLKNLQELNVGVNLDTKQETQLEKNALERPYTCTGVCSQCHMCVWVMCAHRSSYKWKCVRI